MHNLLATYSSVSTQDRCRTASRKLAWIIYV